MTDFCKFIERECPVRTVTTNPRKSQTTAADADLTKPPISGTIESAPKSLARKYSDLRGKYIKLQQELHLAQHPIRSPQEVERQIAGIGRYFASLNVSEGAVTASNLYNAEFFRTEYDPKYRVALLQWLVERFSKAEPLITGTYNMWTMLLEKEGHSV
jgi:hypothetical protein